MTNKKIILPTLAAVFALMFVAATPYALAEPGDAYVTYKDGNGAKKMHKQPLQVEGFAGGIPVTEDLDRASLREQVTVSLSEAADGLDIQKAKLGVVINENDDKYLVWKLIDVDRDIDSETTTITIHIVDAANAENTAIVTKEYDSSMKDKRHGNGPNPTQFSELHETRIFNGISA